eukprot:TRINITY_DN13217_c0_g1_i1.p1 TRINITY_DN13217_c0_g1~~TRINITY_DN13217_c0_g1_i1.p1  ORF type:complete len:434 (+),score=87.23 TRINITY_DN13217_c0_g1_i1:14-1315(+)
MEGGGPTTTPAWCDTRSFAENPTLEEMRAAIKLVKGIIEMDRNDHVVFSYVIVADSTFPPLADAPDEATLRQYKLLRECRGIVFLKTGELISRRFQKFFNVGEHQETYYQNIDMSQPHVILEKLDGSMVSPYRIGGRLIFATKKGPSPVGNDAEAHCQKLLLDKSSGNIDYFSFLNTYLDLGYTATFEWCSRASPIILDYPQDKLTLIALRHIVTGAYMKHEEMAEIAARYNIPVVGVYKMTAPTFKEFMELVKHDKGLEGCVVRFDDGFMVKVKTMWYHDLNRGLHLLTKTKQNNEKYVWKVILDNKYDDMKGYISVDERDRLDRFANDLIKNLHITAEEIKKETEQAVAQIGSATDRKGFAEFVKTKPALMHPIYWKAWRGEEMVETVVEHVLKNLDRKMEDMRTLLARGIQFADYKRESFTAKRAFSEWH